MSWIFVFIGAAIAAIPLSFVVAAALCSQFGPEAVVLAAGTIQCALLAVLLGAVVAGSE